MGGSGPHRDPGFAAAGWYEDWVPARHSGRLFASPNRRTQDSDDQSRRGKGSSGMGDWAAAASPRVGGVQAGQSLDDVQAVLAAGPWRRSGSGPRSGTPSAGRGPRSVISVSDHWQEVWHQIQRKEQAGQQQTGIEPQAYRDATVRCHAPDAEDVRQQAQGVLESDCLGVAAGVGSEGEQQDHVYADKSDPKMPTSIFHQFISSDTPLFLSQWLSNHYPNVWRTRRPCRNSVPGMRVGLRCGPSVLGAAGAAAASAGLTGSAPESSAIVARIVSSAGSSSCRARLPVFPSRRRPGGRGRRPGLPMTSPVPRSAGGQRAAHRQVTCKQGLFRIGRGLICTKGCTRAGATRWRHLPPPEVLPLLRYGPQIAPLRGCSSISERHSVRRSRSWPLYALDQPISCVQHFSRAVAVNPAWTRVAARKSVFGLTHR